MLLPQCNKNDSHSWSSMYSKTRSLLTKFLLNSRQIKINKKKKKRQSCWRSWKGCNGNRMKCKKQLMKRYLELRIRSRRMLFHNRLNSLHSFWRLSIIIYKDLQMGMVQLKLLVSCQRNQLKYLIQMEHGYHLHLHCCQAISFPSHLEETLEMI